MNCADAGESASPTAIRYSTTASRDVAASATRDSTCSVAVRKKWVTVLVTSCSLLPARV
ncbi:Uncharacterised protein [Mycobacteroides abscessus subsp. abscessus]|nr:Uncharacterised protein [Mycobacteroides abscessus subsp. abscessus]